MRAILVFVFLTGLILTNFLCVSFADEAEGENGKMEFSGVIEEEFGYAAAEGNSESGFTFAKVELGLDVSPVSNAKGHVLFKYEQGEGIEVEEGTIGLKILAALPVDLWGAVGRVCIPFGQFDSHFVTDPFTCDIGETHESVLQLLISHEVIESVITIYNEGVGLKGSDGNDQIRDVAAKVTLTLPEGVLGRDLNASLSASFITNMAGTDGLTDMIPGAQVAEKAAGVGGFVNLAMMGISLNGELIAAAGDIKTLDGKKLTPSAFNLELGYSLPDMPVEVAGKFERLSLDDGNASNRFGGVITIGLFDEAASLALEFLREDDGETASNSLTGQLAMEF